jgi:hypothetical protein
MQFLLQMRTLEIILDEAAVSLVWAVGAEIAQKNGVVTQKKMRRKGRKEEKREQGSEKRKKKEAHQFVAVARVPVQHRGEGLG